MAEQWRDDDHGRRQDEDRREFLSRGGQNRGYGYGAREGGGSERAYRDRADPGFGDREGRFGRSGAGPVSGDGAPRWADQDGDRQSIGQRTGREADYGDRRARGGFPGYGDRVGYLDRGVSGEPGYEGGRQGYGGGAAFGSNSGQGYAGQQRGDYGNTPGGDYRSVQGGFAERDSGNSYGTTGWETDDTPTWRQLNRNHEGDRTGEAYGRNDRRQRGDDRASGFAGYGGAQMYDGGPDEGSSDRLGGLSASRAGYGGRREEGYGGAWGAFGQSLSGPGQREESGPHRGRGPRGWKRSDDRIREDIHERLADDPHLDASDIDVMVSDGEVTLSGHVDDRPSRRRAEDLVERVSGVGHVQNNLRVRDRQGEGSPGAGASQSIGAGQALGGGENGRMGQVSGANQPNTGAIGRTGSDTGIVAGDNPGTTLATGPEGKNTSRAEAMSSGESGPPTLSAAGPNRNGRDDPETGSR